LFQLFQRARLKQKHQKPFSWPRGIIAKHCPAILPPGANGRALSPEETGMSKLLHFSVGTALVAAVTWIGAIGRALFPEDSFSEDSTPQNPAFYLSGARSRPWWS
jgi:hypothetical protein